MNLVNFFRAYHVPDRTMRQRLMVVEEVVVVVVVVVAVRADR